MSNYNWLLDPGHGGMKNGVYTTAPKKMCKFPDGVIIYEGVIVRAITQKVVTRLSARRIDHAIIPSEIEDTPLELRVAMADKIYAKYRNSIFVSIHINAAPTPGTGSGLEIYTSKGQTKSDKIATIFCDTYKRLLPEFRFRADSVDGDADKEEDFYVLRKTDCPALLIENLFMDNRLEADFLMSEAGQWRIATAIEESIVQCENLKPI